MSRGEKCIKKKVKIKTQNEKIGEIEIDMDVGHWTYQKTQLLESRRNSAM